MSSVEGKEPQNWHNCGTHSGYQSHRKRGEIACDSCRAANTLYRKNWGNKNRERSNQIAYNWGKNNPDKVRGYMRNVARVRRAKKLLVESDTYTQEMILELYGFNCHICSKEIDLKAPQHPKWGEGWELGLQLDHVVPLSSGGNDKIENIRPAHAKCNISKGSKTASTL